MLGLRWFAGVEDNEAVSEGVFLKKSTFFTENFRVTASEDNSIIARPVQR